MNNFKIGADQSNRNVSVREMFKSIEGYTIRSKDQTISQGETPLLRGETPLLNRVSMFSGDFQPNLQMFESMLQSLSQNSDLSLLIGRNPQQ